MHTRPAGRALALGLVGALLVAPASADGKLAPAPSPAPKTVPPPPPPPAASEEPDAGDANIADEPLEPGQLGRATGAPGPKQPVKRTLGMGGGTRTSSVEQGLALSDQGDQAFDAGDYPTAVRLYSKALELISENQTNHMTRSVVLANVVTALEQLYASEREVAHLRTAQRLIQEYLRACKTKHGTGCERFAETQEARTRLLALGEAIDATTPLRNRIPPEIDTAPGGKPYDLSAEQPSAPGWIGPAIAGGMLLAGGGAAVIYYAATADKYGPIYTPREGEVADTGDGGNTDGTGTGTDSGTATNIEISPETKGKLFIGVGAFMAAAGIGFAVLGAMGLAKHRRLNRERAQSLAVVPAFGRGSAGLAVSGRF